MMNRREFIKSAIAVAAVSVIPVGTVTETVIYVHNLVFGSDGSILRIEGRSGYYELFTPFDISIVRYVE